MIAISMPPRRSCFARAISSGCAPVPNFNATTAFLLPASLTIADMLALQDFNATTAFLLLGRVRVILFITNDFNATTAFLLLFGPSAGKCYSS